jgi:amino acid adenylation domain-containing protein
MITNDPKTTDLQQRLAALSPTKQRLLQRRLGQENKASTYQQIRSREDRSGPAPLSFSQQRLWLIQQLEPDGARYNMPKALRLKGILDRDALKQALDQLVARHEILRTRIEVMDGEPVQRVAATGSVELPLIDLSHWPATEQEKGVHHFLVQATQRPFDLSKDIMLRAALFQVADREHILLLVTHHIATDHWSTAILLRELALLYEACAKGQPLALPPVPIQYADFALWQRRWFGGEALEQQLAYWREQLGGELPILNLPTDRPRPKVQSYQGARHTFVVPQALVEQLKDLSRGEQATLFMSLLTAFKILLYRYTHQEDIAIGSVIAGRRRVETEKLIGFFVNTLVLRTDLSGSPTFRELLGRVREVTLGAYDHQDLPFEKLVEVLQPERDLSRTPLFQVMFDYVTTSDAPLDFFNLSVERLEIDKGQAIFDLSLNLYERPDGVKGVFDYNTDLFEAATIARLAGHFQRLLEGLATQPDVPIWQLPILTEAEAYQLLVEWNKTTAHYPRERCIHHLFEAQVEQTPDAVAVVFEKQSLTYRELNVRANQLAHHLSKCGVGPEALVAICMERSLEMVVGVLAILKAGGAYVPIDPIYPKERQAFMLEDINSSLLLTQSWLLKNLPSYQGKVICLDKEVEGVSDQSQENPISGVRGDHLAYVIFTSGSTGRPKGVTIPHRAISNHMFWILETFAFGEADRLLQKTSFSFDASVWEFYASLLSGGQLIVARPEGHRDAEYLVKTILEQQITILQLVPSQLQLLLSVPDFENCRSLRTVFCGGEALSLELVEQFFRCLPGTELVNLYGPTEATIDTTFWRCESKPGHFIAPIGRPIANTKVYILDSHLNPVPIGVPGELYIGGAGLARGYLNRPALTAEKFIPNRFKIYEELRMKNKELGIENEGSNLNQAHFSFLIFNSSLLYRTGDLVRYLPDGNIEYLGRLDHQVKIRGFRIELEEIETVLSSHPAIREVVVVDREDEAGDKRLVAYFVVAPEAEPGANELRAWVKAKLPEYMVPTAFVRLAAIPLMPNGKINRRALPAPGVKQPGSPETLTLPRTPIEQQLAGIWQKLLRLERIDIESNFFELGGHSLLATQVVSRVEAAFQVALPLRSLFEAPTIAELSQVVERLKNDGIKQRRPVLETISREAYRLKRSPGRI